ncbi:hypothetical protein MMC18_004901 [Xylographa bjoerkii]|nr:hypothetical protein [Xylographa bjoerkii]
MSTGYGPNNLCTLATCNVNISIYEYRPSLAANLVFVILFALSLIVHIIQGVKYRTWGFLFAMCCGCVVEIVGYIGRILLWQNPFSFNGFLIQIICITIGPAFLTAGIYLTLFKCVTYIGPQLSRFSPKLYYWIFIPCDIISLSLQGSGGGLSSSVGSSGGNSSTGVAIALAGLVFQVFTLALFIILALDYAVRVRRAPRNLLPETKLHTSFKIFLGFLSTATVLIFIRCIYRIDELSNGYTGPLIHDEGLFIGLEGVMIILSTFALNIAHPGPVFNGAKSAHSQDTIVVEQTLDDKRRHDG